MKKINLITFSKLAVGVMIAVGAVFVTGCTKDAKEDIAMPGEGTRVVISVGGINEGNSGSFNKIQAAAGNAVASDKSNELISADGFDVLITRPSSSVSQLGFKDKIRAAATSSDGLKAEVPMTNGNAYRVYLRKQGATTLESVALTSGTAGSIAVEKGATYEWFALSYNSTTAVPEANGTDVVLEDISSLLYAKGTFDVGTGEGDIVVPLAVVFKPRVTKAVIEINTLGLFADVASAEVTVTGLYAAPESIDVVSGELTGDNSTAQPISFNDFVAVENFGRQRLVAEAYVAGNADENITVSVSNLRVDLDNGDERDFGTATLTKQFLPEQAMEQNIVLNFIESPIITNRGGTTVSWARSNLYYEPGFNTYRFFHTNPFVSTEDVAVRDKSFFSFKGHIPRQFADADEANQKDPCALVYPAGLWKTPSDVELRSLTSTNGLIGDLLGNVLSVLFPAPGTTGATFGDNYIEYEIESGANPVYGEATNKLRFNYNGIQNNISVASGLVDLSLGQVGEVASIWSSDRVLDVDLLNLGIGVGAWGYLGATAPGVLLAIPPRPERAIGSRGAGLLNLDILDLGLLGSGFQNVRCVRDGSWDPEAGDYNPYPVLTDL
ncbi:hypothetical protein HP439_05860 [Sphingobacterium shayense]|uniref:hypothetical protein n=1 Tax=Sphingobacterium shayense TaxID=626343 RepID=UPI00155360F3|nr:hypothetical protein [Sphingobacterium shayense]NQD70244.1 hypothetical protein [Sphingobacterium shayense]